MSAADKYYCKDVLSGNNHVVSRNPEETINDRLVIDTHYNLHFKIYQAHRMSHYFPQTLKYQ